MYDKNKIIGFIGILPQPSTHKHLRRVTRLVILPDYQGIGLGTRLLNFAASYWQKKGSDICIVTTAKNFIFALRRSPRWRMTRYGISKGKQTDIRLRTWEARKVPTASFMYKPIKKGFK